MDSSGRRVDEVAAEAALEAVKAAVELGAGLSPVLRYRGRYGSHASTATLLLTLGARPVTQEELDARAAAAR